MLSRRAFLRTAGALVMIRGRVAAAQEARPLEDWHAASAGATGVPVGWRPYETPFGNPRYDFAIVDDDGRRALHMKSASDHSTIAKEVTIRLAATPVLTWEWKVVAFPDGADLRQKKTSDATGHIFVLWPRVPAMLRSRLIGYVWDAALPVGTVVPSRKTGTVTFVVVRSGLDGRGQWVTVQRNLIDDYRRIYREEPEDPKGIALSIDTNDTHSSAEALFGRIGVVAS